MTKLATKLSRNFPEAFEKFKNLKDGKDVADLLEIPYGQLIYLIYRVQSEKRYTRYEVPKKRGGVRILHAPSVGISILQQKLKPFLDATYRPKKSAHGFIANRGIKTNAESHIKSRFVLNIDLEDFFGSINFGRVRGMLMAKPFNIGEKAASILAQLLTYENRLPQGACTSPVISNLIASSLDKKMTGLASAFHLKYSRYADDITFSSKKKTFPSPIFEIGNNDGGKRGVGGALLEAIIGSGFAINHSKVRLQTKGIRQEVTGLTVNEFVNVKRKFVREIRAMIHAWKKFGIVKAEEDHIKRRAKQGKTISSIDGSYFRSVVYGKISYLKMIRGPTDATLGNLVNQIGDLDENPPKFIKTIISMSGKYDVFIGHASEDKNDVARPIWEECKKKAVNAFFDEQDIDWGDSLTEKINHGLGQARFFLAIISSSSIGKKWPTKELNSALARDIAGEQKILPLIVGDAEVLLKSLPLMADKLYLEWKGDPEAIADRLQKMLNP